MGIKKKKRNIIVSDCVDSNSEEDSTRDCKEEATQKTKKVKMPNTVVTNKVDGFPHGSMGVRVVKEVSMKKKKAKVPQVAVEDVTDSSAVDAMKVEKKNLKIVPQMDRSIASGKIMVVKKTKKPKIAKEIADVVSVLPVKTTSKTI